MASPRSGFGSVMQDTVIIGSRVRTRRERLRLSQAALAELLGVNTECVGRIERGERDTTLWRFIELCDLLETTPNYLLGYNRRP